MQGELILAPTYVASLRLLVDGCHNHTIRARSHFFLKFVVIVYHKLLPVVTKQERLTEQPSRRDSNHGITYPPMFTVWVDDAPSIASCSADIHWAVVSSESPGERGHACAWALARPAPTTSHSNFRTCTEHNLGPRCAHHRTHQLASGPVHSLAVTLGTH